MIKAPLTIWKYRLEDYWYDGRMVLQPRFEIPMPKGAKILCLQTQDNTPCIWAQIEGNHPTEPREFYITGTGHHMIDDPDINPKYIGTYQQDDGMFVFHVFELQETNA